MPFQFNIGDHASPIPRYRAFPKGSTKYSMLKWTRSKLFRMVKNNPRCNTYFRSLPNGRSLTNLINDSRIWVNYDPTIPPPLTGETHVPTGEIALPDLPFIKGRWVLLGTIIHELAHVNGAPITGGDTRAEEALYHCGLGTAKEYYDDVDDPSTPYTPGVGG